MRFSFVDVRGYASRVSAYESLRDLRELLKLLWVKLYALYMRILHSFCYNTNVNCT